MVEDEEGLVSALRSGLGRAGYAVDAACTAVEATQKLATTVYDLAILDITLPDGNGLDLCRAIRRGEIEVASGSDLRVLMLTARAGLADRVRGLDEGADDYLTKPFGIDELLARLRAVLRRSGAGDDQPVVQVGDATVDLAAKRVTISGQEVRLTPTEWHLLEVLVRHPGKLLSQRQLLIEVWGPGYETAHGNLRFYMGQLRRKLEPDSARPRHLITEPGMGYRFEP